MQRELGMLVALVLICTGLYLNNHDFLAANNVTNTTRQIAMLGILSMGVSFVIIQGGIDLSVGSIVGLTGVLIAKFSSEATGGLGHPLWVGIVVALAAATAIGLFQGLLIVRLKLQPFVVTLGGMLLFRGIAQVIADGATISMSRQALKDFGKGGFLWFRDNTANGKWWDLSFTNNGSIAVIPWSMLAFAAVLILAAYVLHFTVFGRYLFAIGGNRDAAVYSGLPVARCEVSTYVISALCAALSGICYCGYIGQMSHAVGVGYELYAIAAAVLGGISLRGGEGTAIGILIGAALLRVIDNGINMVRYRYQDAAGAAKEWRLSSNYSFVVIGTVILLAVVLDQLFHIYSERRKRRAPQAAVVAA